MARRSLRAALLATVALAVTAGQPAAAPTARGMYDAALSREQALRAREADGRQPLAAEIRALISAYEAIVRRHPGSGYSDNALWRAARLAADAYQRFGNDSDRRAAIRLLRMLRDQYPSSSLVAKAADDLSRLQSQAATEPAGGARTVATRATSGSAGAGPAPAIIRSIHRAVLPEVIRITLELDREVPYAERRLANPSRMFLDLKGTRTVPSLTDAIMSFDSDPVRQIRVGRHPNNTTRVVVDLQGAPRYSVFALYNPYRLVIDCDRPRPPVAARQSLEKELLASSLPAAPLMLPPPAAEGGSAIGQMLEPSSDASARNPVEPTETTAPRDDRVESAAASRPIPAAPPAVAALPPPSAPSTNLRGGFSVARQLGLGISRIVIDAGHGGHDPGAQALGVSESDVVLDVAMRLEKLLRKQPGVEVILTRRTNTYIPLEERTAIANREDADLFLSIHVNASRNERARGIETYFLNFASNPDAAAVAARENSASERTMHNLPEIVKAIALGNKVDESRDFATFIQQAMIERLKSHNKQLRDLGVKQAPFMVLIGASMPSVLAEISFLTNREESRLLRNGGYRQRIADALFNGISQYQRSLKRVGTVAEGTPAPRER